MALTISNCSAEIATYFKIIFQITNMMSSATSAITTASGVDFVLFAFDEQ